MKKLLLTGTSIIALSASLVGCGTWNAVDTVGDTFVSTGRGVVNTTGYAVDRSMEVVGTGVGLLTGRVATYQDVAVYRKNGIVYHNGHAYHIQHGKYVIVR